MKKVMTLFLCAALIVSCAACGAQSEAQPASPSAQPSQPSQPQIPYVEAADGFAGGSGTETDPYQIETAGQLARLSELCTHDTYWSLDVDEARHYTAGYYVLTADIQLNDAADYAGWGTNPPSHQWQPIGESQDFKGHFDGNGHVIRGMYICSELDYNGSNGRDPGAAPGLFGNINGATVENVTLEQSYIAVKGDIDYAGGIAARAYQSNIANCSSDLILETHSSIHAGGVVGWAQSGGSIASCAFHGTIYTAGNGTYGGVAGYIGGLDSVSSCVNDGTFAAPPEGDSLATVGGVIGTVSPGEASSIRACTNQADLTVRDAALGGVIGRISVTKVMDVHLGEDPVIGSAHLEVADCENNGSLRSDSQDYAVGGIAYTVFNSSDQVNGEAGDMKVTLTHCVNNGSVSSPYAAGGVIGECSSAIAWALEACGNTGPVHSGGHAGGVIAMAAPSRAECRIADCANDGEIYSETGSAGGILDYYFGFSLTVSEENAGPLTIDGCTNRGRISGGSAITGMGGIVGSSQSNVNTLTVRSCVNEGDIHGDGSFRIGGIFGNAAFSNMLGYEGPAFVVSGCVNRGALSSGDGTVPFGDGRTPGASPESEAPSPEDEAFAIEGGSAMGGIVGYCKQGIVENCVNVGDIRMDANDYAPTAQGTAKDLHQQTNESETSRSIFCGGICGEYFYLESNGSTLDNTGMHDCVYVDTAPLAAYISLEDAGIENVAAMPLAQAEARAEGLTK